MSDFSMIQAAERRLKGHARTTPILSSPFIDEIAGRRVLVKAECLQLTGSFKFRGAWSAISAMSPEERQAGVLAYSSGNHAQGVAYAAKLNGIPSTIVMPSDAPMLKIENTKAYGAEVILYDRAGGESREEIGEALRDERGLSLIRPFDDPRVIAGQGTCGVEIASQASGEVSEAEVLVCCGGGGLTSGIALALEELAPGLTVRPCEPVGFDDVARSLESGRIQEADPGASSICDAIVTKSAGDLTFPILSRLCGPGLVVTDEECLRAMGIAFQRLKIALEPGGAVSLAAALFHGGELSSDTAIAVCTGGNVDPGTFAEALKTL